MKNLKPVTPEFIKHITKRTLWDEIKYYLYYAPIRYLDMLPRKIYWFFQRGFRGYGDNDTWDFDYYLATVISQGLKHLKKYYHGTDPTEEVFDKIIEGFECAQLLMEQPGLEHGEKMEAERIKNEGFDLFKKYFNYLWD